MPRARSVDLLKLVAVAAVVALPGLGIPGRSRLHGILLAAVLTRPGVNAIRRSLPCSRPCSGLRTFSGGDQLRSELVDLGKLDRHRLLARVLSRWAVALGPVLFNALLLTLAPVAWCHCVLSRGRGGLPERAGFLRKLGPALAFPIRISCMPRSLAFKGMLFGGLFAMIALWRAASWGSGNCFDFGMVLSAIFLRSDRCVACSLTLAPPGRYAFDGRLVCFGHPQSVPGWGAVALFSALVGEWAPQAIMGCRRSTMLRDKAMAGDRLEQLRGVVGGLAGRLGMGLLLAQLGPDCSYAVAHCSWVALGCL